MTAPTLTHSQMVALKPCDVGSIEKMIGDATTWDGRQVTAAEAVKAGISFSSLVWVTSAVAQEDKDVERRLQLWLADCAARVLHIYESHAPTDMRVRDCIVASRQFARGVISKSKLAAARAAAGAAWATAGDAAGDAWAAGAAWAAAGDAWATAGDAAGAARAAGAAGAAWAAAGAARAAEEKWQFARLVKWLSDNEPEDWPLPAVQTIEEAAQ